MLSLRSNDGAADEDRNRRCLSKLQPIRRMPYLDRVKYIGTVPLRVERRQIFLKKQFDRRF